MASPEELTPVLPETLPEDFSDWDSEAPPAVTPVNLNEWDTWQSSHSLARTAKQNWYSAERDAKSPAAADKPRVSSSVQAAPVHIEQDKKTIDSNRETKSVGASAKREDWEEWLASYSSGDTARPAGQSAKREATSSHTFDRPQATFSTPTAEVPLKQKKLRSESTNESSSHAGKLESHKSNDVHAAPSETDGAAADSESNPRELTVALEGESSAALFSSFSFKNIETPATEKKSRKKWIVIGSVGVSAVLISGGFLLPRFHHGAGTQANQPVQQVAEATDSEMGTDIPKPTAGEPSTENVPAAATEEQKTADDRATAETERANLARAQARAKAEAEAQQQAQVMNEQLNAPAQIPKQVAESGPAPASLSAGAVNDMGGSGANDSILNARREPVVRGVPPKPITVSSGVANGMLIQKTAPVYPPIARSARVSGTVELHATISKGGAIKDLSVVSGPQMLREAAVDAVRTWRYKPYLLNNQPTEVETTIDIEFALGG